MQGKEYSGEALLEFYNSTGFNQWFFTQQEQLLQDHQVQALQILLNLECSALQAIVHFLLQIQWSYIFEDQLAL